MALVPRDYQLEAETAVIDAWRRGVDAPAVVLPTGAGKTVIFTRLPDHPDVARRGRVLVLAHRWELLLQAAAKLRDQAPHLRVGFVQGDLDQVGADVVLAMVQTLKNPRRLERLRDVGTIVVDECHHATAPSYLAILEWYGVLPGAGRAAGRRAYAVGFTATMTRGDGASLGKVWSEVVYRKPISDLIRDGHLVRPDGILVELEGFDLRNVKKSAGDYDREGLQRELVDAMAPERIVEAWLRHASGRPTISFGPTVEFGQLVAKAFEAAGVRAAAVWGAMPMADRIDLIGPEGAFMRGELDLISNCGVLTEGTDLPPASCAIIARPTRSAGLYVQMVGRVLRKYPGKANALVLDVVGATKRHPLSAPVDLVGEDRELRAQRPDPDDELTDPDEITLADLLDGMANEQGLEPRKEYRDGKIVATVVDLFHGSRWAWNRTYRGWHFVEVGEGLDARYLVLGRGSDGLWFAASVPCAVNGRTRNGHSSEYIATGIADLSYAMRVAEDDINWRERGHADRKASWRSKPITTDQRRRLEAMGVKVGPRMRGGEASELIGRDVASRRLDVLIPRT